MNILNSSEKTKSRQPQRSKALRYRARERSEETAKMYKMEVGKQETITAKNTGECLH